MSDAPERIWVSGWDRDPTGHWWHSTELKGLQEYIRADLCAHAQPRTDQESLAVAREDAREAEDYAKEVEADRKKTYEALLKLSRIHGEAEAQLAKAVEALEAGVICTTKHGGAAEFLRIARTTLAELKGGTGGKD